MQKIAAEADDTEPFSHIVNRLEPEHFGEYVMIDPVSENYVIASTVTEVHTKFIEAFGAETRGHCLRIGASPFATA
ncbi:MAG: hypothetical protein ACOYB4_00870 [Methyloceanibacter sp.]